MVENRIPPEIVHVPADGTSSSLEGRVTVPEAGWYRDDSDPSRARWWDGFGWSQHTHALAPDPTTLVVGWPTPTGPPDPSPAALSAPPPPDEASADNRSDAVTVGSSGKDLMRLVVSTLIVLFVAGVSTWGAWAVLSDGTRSDEQLAELAALAGIVGALVGCAACVYWDAWTFQSAGVRIAHSPAWTWPICVLAIGVLALPAYFYHRVRLISPSEHGSGSGTDLTRPDGSGLPAPVGALLGLVLLGILAIGVPIAIAAASGAAAATTPRSVDTAATESGIEAWVQQRTGYMAAVTCPERSWKKGESFYCTATILGTGDRLQVLVQMDDEKGALSWQAVG